MCSPVISACFLAVSAHLVVSSAALNLGQLSLALLPRGSISGTSETEKKSVAALTSLLARHGRPEDDTADRSGSGGLSGMLQRMSGQNIPLYLPGQNKEAQARGEPSLSVQEAKKLPSERVEQSNRAISGAAVPSGVEDDDENGLEDGHVFTTTESSLSWEADDVEENKIDDSRQLEVKPTRRAVVFKNQIFPALPSDGNITTFKWKKSYWGRKLLPENGSVNISLRGRENTTTEGNWTKGFRQIGFWLGPSSSNNGTDGGTWLLEGIIKGFWTLTKEFGRRILEQFWVEKYDAQLNITRATGGNSSSTFSVGNWSEGNSTQEVGGTQNLESLLTG